MWCNGEKLHWGRENLDIVMDVYDKTLHCESSFLQWWSFFTRELWDIIWESHVTKMKERQKKINETLKVLSKPHAKQHNLYTHMEMVQIDILSILPQWKVRKCLWKYS